MSQSLLYHAFGVRDGYEYVKTEYGEGRVEFHLVVKEQKLVCPKCGAGPAMRRGKRWRRLRTVPTLAQGSGAGDRSAAMPVPGVRARLRGFPLFVPAYAHYTHGLAEFACELSRFMTLSEVAALAHLGWDTVKEIVKADLGRRSAQIPLRGVRRLAIDEIHLGKKAKFLTLVIDLDTGRILWVAKGRGKEALVKFWRRLRLAKARIEGSPVHLPPLFPSASSAGACERERRLLERGARTPARGRHRLRPLSPRQTGERKDRRPAPRSPARGRNARLPDPQRFPLYFRSE